MRINYSKALVWARGGAIALASFVIVTVAGGFILQLCEDADWYEHPWATVASVIALVHLIIASPYFHWLGGAAIGFAVGIWLDDTLRRLAASARPKVSAPQAEKGYLDYQIEMEKSGREMSRVLGKASRHTIAIGKKIDKQTAKIARLRTKIGATSTESLARSARKIAHSAAADFDSYCEEVSGLNSRFAHLGGIIIEAIRGLSEHQPGWVSDKALAEINDLHTACTGAKVGLTSMVGALDGSRGVAANLNAAIDRTQAQLNGFIATIDSLISVCTYILERAATEKAAKTTTD